MIFEDKSLHKHGVDDLDLIKIVTMSEAEMIIVGEILMNNGHGKLAYLFTHRYVIYIDNQGYGSGN